VSVLLRPRTRQPCRILTSLSAAISRGGCHAQGDTIKATLFIMYYLDNLLNPCNRSLVENLAVSQLVIFPVLFGTGGIITIYTRPRLWFLKSQLSPRSHALFHLVPILVTVEPNRPSDPPSVPLYI